MQKTERLFAALFLGIAFAPHLGATDYPSDGSEANVQAIHDTNAHDGDTITLPAGTFIWTAGVHLTKGVTISGRTTVTGAGTANCTANDQTIIIDERARNTSGALFKATIPAGRSFRLTGITFQNGGINQVANNGAIRFSSTGLVQSARIDHCHFDHLYWGYTMELWDWIYGVEDHNLIECNGNGLSHGIHHSSWNNSSDGNGSWADFPYYGSEKFWFIEDNTIKGSGGVQTSAGVDCDRGGRYVARHNYFQNASNPGHGTEGSTQRGQRCNQVYNNTFYWTFSHSGASNRSGSTIWHDNTFLGVNAGAADHTALPYFRQLGLISNDLSNWGFADGTNGWDKNDPHGVYLSGTAASHTTINGPSGTFTTGTTMTAHAYKGMQIRNDNVAAACYLHSAYIQDNSATTITYYYGGTGRGAPLVFNSGDEFSVRKVLIALDQNGRGKGDVIYSKSLPRQWPNQQQETCFSWNNKNTDTGQVLGIHNSIPTQHAGTDYVNLGAGLPANQIPAQVTAAYPVSVNGGSAYDHEYTYPHPLVTGEIPFPTPTASPTATSTSTPSATATATATFTPTPTATATFTPTATATATATFTPTPTPSATSTATATATPTATVAATPTATATFTPTPTPPSPPTSLSTTSTRPGKIDLQWVQSTSPGVTSNGVYRRLMNGGTYPTSPTYTINANTSFRDNQVSRGVSYCYEVTAINANGESGPSNESCTQAR